MKPAISPLFSILIIVSLLFSILIIVSLLAFASAAGGRWDLLQSNSGVSAMHMQLLHNDRVIIFDRTDFGKSNILLPNGKCRRDPNELVLKVDYTAHSIEYNVLTNTVRPLMILTDTWCSSGTVSPNGCLVQTGGFNDGDHGVRTFCPCTDNNCDWQEVNRGLSNPRWYATNQILPDGSTIVIGGRDQFNYEFLPKTGGATKPIQFPFLKQTNDAFGINNLYPFVHLNLDGNLFIFANNRAILYNYKKGQVVKNYPQMPGADPRNYPSTGSSVLLPLKASNPVPEVMVCGGAPKGSYRQEGRGVFMKALNTCGRIKINDKTPSWSMETMPMPRVMGDMVLLPTGHVLITNGAQAGIAGWEKAREPVQNPLLYNPDAAANGTRFRIQQQSNIPRMYHSTAILLRDGRVLVGGSNPHEKYRFTGVLYPTELSLEAFSPDYLNPGSASLRPKIISAGTVMNYGKQFALKFTVGKLSGAGVSVTMVAPSFTTHSYSMNQRLLVLEGSPAKKIGGGGGDTYTLTVAAPKSSSWAPPGYYMLFVVNKGTPSDGIWVRVK